VSPPGDGSNVRILSNNSGVCQAKVASFPLDEIDLIFLKKFVRPDVFTTFTCERGWMPCV